MSNFYVYCFTNKINGKIYIGKTNNIDKRINSHCLACGDCPAFHNAIKKYGIDNFNVSILGEYVIEQESLDAEIKFIAEHKSNIKDYGYNLTNGGDGISGHKHTLETRIKMSQSLKGRISPNKNKIASSETIKKLSESHMGRTGYWLDKKLSEEAKNKKSHAMKGKTWKLIDGKRVWFAKELKNE